MRVYEAIVKGLEGIGVEAAFGGAGENAAGLMLALEALEEDPPGHHAARAGRVVHGLRLCDVHRQAGLLLRDSRTGSVQSVLRPRRGDVRLLPGPRGLGLRVARMAGPRVAQRDLGPQPHARLPRDVRRPRRRSRSCSTDIADTCDVLEEAVNIAFEGRPGPVHIHVPENLTHQGVEVENYHDIRLDVAPVLPDPARVEEIAVDAGGRDRQAEEDRGARRLRSDSKRCGGRGQAADRALPDPAADDAGRQGNRVRRAPARGRCLLRRRPLQRLEGLPRGRRRALHRQLAQPARHVQLPRGPVRRTSGSSTSTSPRTRSTRPTRPTTRSSPTRARRSPPSSTRSSRRSATSPEADVDGQDYEARHIIHLTDSIHPGELAQTIGRMLPPRAILLADAGAHLAWLAYFVELEEGQNFRKAGSFGPMAGHVNGAIGLKLAHPDRTVVVGCGDGCYSARRLRADDRRAVRHPRHLGDLRRRGVQADQGLPARDLRRERRWSSSRTPTSPPTRGPAGRTAIASRRWRSSRTRSAPRSPPAGRR